MGKYILSKYNCFKPGENNLVVGINLQNKVFFCIDDNQYQKLNQYSENLVQLENDDPVFFSTMTKLGVIAELDSDENYNKEILLTNRIIVFGRDNYKLTINPTLNCNFSCWYCYEDHTNKRMTKPIIEATLKYIEKTIKNGRFSTFNLDWFGGEPLLCYETVMKPIAIETKKICEEHGVKLLSGITTNGYLITKEMISFFREINMNSFQITLDGKKETHDAIRFPKHKRESYDKIVENICLLTRELNPKNLALRINYTSESIKEITKIIDSFPKSLRGEITILLQQVWQDKDANKLSVSDIDQIKIEFEKAGFMTEKEILDCKGYKCYADLFNEALINYDGRIFKCTARNFEKEEGDGVLSEEGDIIWFDSLSKKVANATFENDKCMPCKYLPVCHGPCSQKISTIKQPEDFDKYCFIAGMEDTLDYMLTTFAKSGKRLAPLFEFRS